MRSFGFASLTVLLFASGCGARIGATNVMAPVAQVLDSEAWVTLWSDDFNRAKLGKSWQPVRGEWSIETEALKGILMRDPKTPASQFYSADLVLKGRALPETVEVQYETWSPDEIGSEAKFLSDVGRSGIISALYGTPHPALRAKAAVVFIMTPPNRFQIVATNPGFTFKPDVHHKVRIVRQPEGITTFVDGEQVVSADSGTRPENREKNLHLVGTFGKERTVVFFDNLKIRVPAVQKD